MKPVVVSVALLLAVGISSAQSLGDVARKERERRESNAEAGRSAVVSASGTGETLVQEAEPPGESGRIQELEREVREANEKLDELLERTPGEPVEEKPESRPPTARDRADEYARQMLEVRRSYQEVLGRCLGGSWTNVYGEVVGNSGDTASCDEAEAMRAEYDSLYHKLWAIEGASILKRDLPKRLDPNRA